MERRYQTSEAAAVIGISPKTLRNMVSKQRCGYPTGHAHLAYEYVADRLVFRESVLKAWIEAEHRLGQQRYERRFARAAQGDPRYVKLEDWNGRGHRCEHCGFVTSWKYRMKNHLASRQRLGRCPLPAKERAGKARSAKKRGRPKGSKNKSKRKPRAKKARDPTKKQEAPQAEFLLRCAHCKQVFADEKELDRHLERRQRLGYCKKPKTKPKAVKRKRKTKRKAQPKKRPSRVKDWKKKPISVLEGWDDDEYLGT